MSWKSLCEGSEGIIDSNEGSGVLGLSGVVTPLEEGEKNADDIEDPQPLVHRGDIAGDDNDRS